MASPRCGFDGGLSPQACDTFDHRKEVAVVREQNGDIAKLIEDGTLQEPEGELHVDPFLSFLRVRPVAWVPEWSQAWNDDFFVLLHPCC